MDPVQPSVISDQPAGQTVSQPQAPQRVVATPAVSSTAPVIDPMDAVAPVNPPTAPVVSPAPTMVQPEAVPTPSALAQPMVNAQAAVIETPPGGAIKGKEMGPVASQELAGFVETVGSDSLENEPLPPEVSSWMEKVSRDTSGEKPPEIVIADTSAQNPTGNYSSEPVFVLPLGQVEMQTALHQSVNDSVRWLAEWCKKIAKKLGQRVAYGN